MVAVGACFFVVFVGHIRRRGAGLVWVLSRAPAAVKHGLGPPAVQCEPRAPPDLPKKVGLEHLRADVKEVELLSSKPGGDDFSHVVNRSGHLPVRTGAEARDLSRVIGVEFGLGWSN